ncbi:hypothetical protein P171DRAFT_483444 [Karstenula rhodostoma CBS 690.94]|uniref:Uncharacterized protein n=1 Tax=Karstenula rhodostoma CBS 690.94 TaxID=1392251 RepID=A0A9P4PJ74_9PLEO|nr:hypothetical protein P171DRAFT_483444 [Karstenula rhodostoma CBS 690.94]
MAEASICFLARDELYKTAKPYAIQYEPHGDVPQTNVIQEMVNNIPVRDLRPLKETLTLKNDGVIVRDLNVQMMYEDFANPTTVQNVYLAKVQDLLREALGTPNVAILEYLVRRRDTSFPLSPGTEYEFAQPVPNAHIDFSPKGISDIVIDRYGKERGQQLLKHHYKIVNVWKPLFGPLLDWPLVFCRLSSTEPDDIEVMDNVFPNVIEESINIHYSTQQDWCYLDRQMDTEAIIFQGGDSKLGVCGGVPHCSFQDKRQGPSVRPRESVEVRALVFYTDELLDLHRVVPSRLHGPKSTYVQDSSRA